MFATPTSYVVTPSRKPFMRIPERASTFLRDVKRRSTRKVKRSKSLVSNKEKLSGLLVFFYSKTNQSFMSTFLIICLFWTQLYFSKYDYLLSNVQYCLKGL